MYNYWHYRGMTEELAYILGVLKGDGSVSTTYRIELTQTKREFAESFKLVLEKIGFSTKIRTKAPPRFAKKPQFSIQVRSKDFANWYHALSLAKIKELVKQNPQFIVAFIRGFYESEGYARTRQTFYWRQRAHTKYKFKKYVKKDPSRKWQTTISFHNSNQELLRMVQKLLAELGFIFTLEGPWESDRIKFGGRKYHEKRYALQTTRKAQIQPFFQKINPCIKNLINKNT